DEEGKSVGSVTGPSTVLHAAGAATEAEGEPEGWANQSVIAGFEILGELGRGGMGVVLRVRDPSFDRTLAVKVLRPSVAKRPAAPQRCLEEARITGQLQHPGIPPVHQLGRLDNGLPFLAMKLIEGRTLAALLRERQGPAQDLPRWIGIFRQVCQ